MNRIISLFFVIVALVYAPGSYAGIKNAGGCAPIDSNGYIYLHPYFQGKNWKAMTNAIDIALPDTLCSQKIIPIKFDIGKNINSTMAIFSTADGNLFTMPAYFTPNIGTCSSGEMGFLSPGKVTLAGIPFTSTTPFYLIKDSLYNNDSIKVIIGVSPQFLLVLTIRPSASSVTRIDTLRMLTTGSIFKISGEYNPAMSRDTSIWVIGAAGMIRKFAYHGSSWGPEVNRSIAGLADTVLCMNGLYAGTSSGRIYKRNTSQVYTLDNSSSKKAVNALYPQGAIGNNGNFLELIGSSWRLDTLGSSNYRYANFIKRPRGFGVELLDAKWGYSAFTYRDSSSKILLTIPPDRYSYVNNGAYRYSGSALDTGMTVYILDPDSNYSDFDLSLKHLKTSISLKTDGNYTISPLQDTETCHVGALRLTDGIIGIGFKSNMVTVKSQTELGAIDANCGVCYWKKFAFSAQQSWVNGDSIILHAGKDILKIAYNTAAVFISQSLQSEEIKQFGCKVMSGKLILNAIRPDMKNILVYNISGRLLASASSPVQSIIELPRSISENVLCVVVIYKNGAVIRRVLPILH